MVKVVGKLLTVFQRNGETIGAVAETMAYEVLARQHGQPATHHGAADSYFNNRLFRRVVRPTRPPMHHTLHAAVHEPLERAGSCAASINTHQACYYLRLHSAARAFSMHPAG